MKEFNQILKERAPLIKKSLIDPIKANGEQEINNKPKIESESK
jgi:hypothetical protein